MREIRYGERERKGKKGKGREGGILEREWREGRARVTISSIKGKGISIHHLERVKEREKEREREREREINLDTHT